MLKNILELLSATPKEIMDAAEIELERVGYDVFRDPEDLFLFASPPQFIAVGHETKVVPMLVAHVDVVGVLPPKKKDLIVNPNGNKISLDPKSEASVLGADDRAGVYALFKIVGSFFNSRPFVVLTDEEEIGGIGARALVDSGFLDDHKDHISCYIELDRKGNGEVVSYDASGAPNEELGEVLFDQGFKLGYGSYSDVCDFTAHTNTSNVNLSVGYYHEHSKGEVLFLDELELTVSRVVSIWSNPLLFEKVFEQEEASGWYRGQGEFSDSIQYDTLMDKVYELSGLAADHKDVGSLVQNFVDDLPPKLLVELVTNLEEVIDELSYYNFDTDELVVEHLINIIMDCEEEEEEDDRWDNDFGLYVDQRGGVVCSKKNRVGCY